MARVTVTLRAIEREALFKLAERESRDLRAQAAVLIRKALEGEGLLPAPNAESAIKDLSVSPLNAGNVHADVEESVKC